MSNEFKVIDTQTGEDVTDSHQWMLGSDGKLFYFKGVDFYSTLDSGDRYQVRRSTGISDKNGRLLFGGECVRYDNTGMVFESVLKQDEYGAWRTGYYQTRDVQHNIEYIEAES